MLLRSFSHLERLVQTALVRTVVLRDRTLELRLLENLPVAEIHILRLVEPALVGGRYFQKSWISTDWLVSDDRLVNNIALRRKFINRGTHSSPFDP